MYAILLPLVLPCMLVLGTQAWASASDTDFGQDTSADVALTEVQELPFDMLDIGEGSAYLPEVWCGEIDDDTTRAVCWRAYQAGLEYYESGLKHRSKVFWWQHLSTRIIFLVVHSLVFIGVYFAWVQFKKDFARKPDERDVGGSFEVSKSGVKVSSPVLGVILLALSLAFFYLYLVYVYPITELF